jgi:hypothetical protein
VTGGRAAQPVRCRVLRWWSGLVAVVALLPAACRSDLTPPTYRHPSDPGPLVVTDRARYSWVERDSVRYTITNVGDAEVFLPQCGSPVEHQRWVDGAWRSVVTPPVGECSSPVRLAGTDTLRGGVSLGAYYFPYSDYYRIVLAAFRDTALAVAWPEGYRVSAPFWAGR